MKVTLVRPTTFINMNTHPLNIGYIYESLSSEDYLQVSFVDGEKIGTKYIKHRDTVNKVPEHAMWGQISQEILSTKPDIIAFSCYSISMTATKYITNILRNLGFTGQIWAGGIHPTTSPSGTLYNIPGLNGVVMGEGEHTFKEVCKSVNNGVPIHSLKGIAYQLNDKVQINESQPMIISMDDLPIPSRTFSGDYSYREHIVLTSRGCPFVCDFCDSKNMWGRAVRYRSAEHVANEIKSVADLGVKVIGLRDDTFTLNKKHVDAICKSINNRGLNKLEYSVGSRIDTMDNDMIWLLKKMNVKAVSFGVETGSAVIQNRSKKKLNISTVVPTVLKTNNAGIKTLTFFMLGHPGETEKDINDTLSLIKQLSKYCKRKNYISINIVCPYPGTGYWDYANRKYGEFIDFYSESYKYYHQARPYVNLTDMDNQVFYSYIDRIKRFADTINVRYRIYQTIENPAYALSIMKKVISTRNAGIVSLFKTKIRFQ